MVDILKKTIFLALILSLVSGCAAHKMEEVHKAGFLGDYSQLKQGGEDQAVLTYIKPGVNFKVYKKLMIDPVEIWYSPDVEYKGIQPDQLKELTDYFHNALVKAVEDRYPVVNAPGEDVLRIRAAITDVIPGKPVTGTLSTLIPIGIAISGTKKAATGTHASVGQTAVEAELIDSLTYERLAAAVDRRAGKKGAFRGEWDDAKDAFDLWAERLRNRLDEWNK